jgi:hypothetical protein
MMAVLNWPFKALGSLTTFILEATGRLLAVLLGIALMIVGILVSLTVIGAIISLPMTLLGFALVIRGLY